MSQKESFVFRKLTKSDIEEFDALQRYAFQITSNEMARTGWSDKAMKQSKKPIFDSSYVLGWFFEGEAIVRSPHRNSLELFSLFAP